MVFKHGGKILPNDSRHSGMEDQKTWFAARLALLLKPGLMASNEVEFCCDQGRAYAIAGLKTE
jgi:hypothetical protein